MKYAFFALLFCGATLVALIKLYEQNLTAQQRATEEAMVKARDDKELAELSALNDVQREQYERVKSTRKRFIAQMERTPSIESMEINSAGDVVLVRFIPSIYTTTANVRVMCEALARQWAITAGLPHVRCESWRGKEMFTSGSYN